MSLWDNRVPETLLLFNLNSPQLEILLLHVVLLFMQKNANHGLVCLNTQLPKRKSLKFIIGVGVGNQYLSMVCMYFQTGIYTFTDLVPCNSRHGWIRSRYRLVRTEDCGILRSSRISVSREDPAS